MRNKPEKEENKNESKKKKILFTADFFNIYHSYGFFGFSSFYFFL
jgi:hypothetical protein